MKCMATSASPELTTYARAGEPRLTDRRHARWAMIAFDRVAGRGVRGVPAAILAFLKAVWSARTEAGSGAPKASCRVSLIRSFGEERSRARAYTRLCGAEDAR